jgi:hypothetical protein
MVNTIKGNQEGFSQQQIHRAKLARELQATVGHPSTNDLKNIIKANLIANCPVTTSDIDRAEQIYGPSVPILKGKTVRRAPKAVMSDYIAVPPEIMSANKHIAVSGDIFFINRVPFFTTISNHIKFTTTMPAVLDTAYLFNTFHL